MIAGACVMAAAAMPSAAYPNPHSPQKPSNGANTMGTVVTKDGTEIYYKDWGSGPADRFQPRLALVSADAFEDQMFFLASRGYRCIAADRRGHGRSSQPWQGNDLDTYADDLAAVVQKLDLKGAIHVGHSTGGGRKWPRYIGRARHRQSVQSRVDRCHSAGDAQERCQPRRLAHRGIRWTAGERPGSRSQFWKETQSPLLWLQPAGRQGLRGRVRESFWLQSMMAGFPASYFCIKAFSETDLTEDLKRFDVPTLVLHGDDDQIVPYADAALLSSKIIKNAKLVIYKGAPHGMCTTQEGSRQRRTARVHQSMSQSLSLMRLIMRRTLAAMTLSVICLLNTADAAENGGNGGAANASPIFGVSIPPGVPAVGIDRGVLRNRLRRIPRHSRQCDGRQGVRRGHCAVPRRRAMLAKLAWKRVPSSEFTGAFVPGRPRRCSSWSKTRAGMRPPAVWGFGRFVGGKAVDRSTAPDRVSSAIRLM